MGRHLHRAAAWLAILLLTACASQPSTVSIPRDWEAQQAALLTLDNWTLRGKLALRSSEQSETASLVWNQRGEAAELRLSGPLGAGATHLESNGETLVINQDGAARSYDISTPEAVAQSTGWALPVKALPFWIRGLPAPEPAPTSTDIENGTLLTLEQAGWMVSYADYRNIGAYRLPMRVTIRSADTLARLVIRQWDMTP